MGGNVFKNNIPTKPIKKENIKPTLKEFFREFEKACPGAVLHFQGAFPLGSTGKKDESGDIDLGIDEKSFTNLEDWNLDQNRVQELFAKAKKRARTATDKQLMKKATIEAIAEKVQESDTDINIDAKGAGNGTLFCEFPQYDPEGNKLEDWVQIDINVGNPDLLKFAYYSDSYSPGSNVKGLHRTQLILAMFTNKGLTFTHNGGVKDKETGRYLATEPRQIINLLNSLYDFQIDEKTLQNFYSLYRFIEENVSAKDRESIYRTYLKVLDRTRCDIPDVFENIWLDNQDRWELTGKFLPPSSRLFPFRED